MKFQGFFGPGHPRSSPIDLPSPVTQIGLSAASPDLPDILSGDTGALQSSARDKPVRKT